MTWVALNRREQREAPGPPQPPTSWLTQELLNYFAGDVRQAEIAALKTVGEPLVVQAEQVEDRRVEIIHVDRVGDDVPADLIRFTDDLPAFDAAARQPNTERERMMVPPGHIAAKARPVIAERCAAEFRRDHHQRRVEQAALVEIVEQGRNRPIDARHQEIAQAPGVLAVRVPVAVLDADEPAPGFDQPPREQTALPEARRAVGFAHCCFLAL